MFFGFCPHQRHLSVSLSLYLNIVLLSIMLRVRLQCNSADVFLSWWNRWASKLAIQVLWLIPVLWSVVAILHVLFLVQNEELAAGPLASYVVRSAVGVHPVLDYLRINYQQFQIFFSSCVLMLKGILFSVFRLDLESVYITISGCSSAWYAAFRAVLIATLCQVRLQSSFCIQFQVHACVAAE